MHLKFSWLTKVPDFDFRVVD